MTVFITGAGSGIGAELARMVAAHGHAVALFDLTVPDTVSDDVAGVAGRPAAVTVHEHVDVRDADAVTGAFAEAVGQIGRPDLVINSAGISRNDVFADATADDFADTIAVNLTGSRNVAAAAYPHLGPGSRLALIASLAGITGGYTYAAYAASKAGVIGLARVLRLEWKPEQIGVSVICPPEIDTPMVRRYATTMHPATRALKDRAGTLPIDLACSDMLEQLERGRFLVVPGAKARRIVRLQRFLPDRVTQRIADRIVARALAGRPAAGTGTGAGHRAGNVPPTPTD